MPYTEHSLTHRTSKSQVNTLLQYAYLVSQFVKQSRSETIRCPTAFQVH